jgi:uncharacterized surface protein with fasciclin (FAS1) repeats
MKNSFKYHLQQAGVALALVFFTVSCNKDVPAPEPITFAAPTGTSIGTIITNDPNYSYLKRALVRANLMTLLQDSTRIFTLFAPDNTAFNLSGIVRETQIDSLPLTVLVPTLQYHLGSEKLLAAEIPNTFPNFPYPTFINPAPTVSALLRLSNYPSTRNGAWVNSVPIKAVDQAASNGVIHTVATLVAPPSRYLWNRITQDPGLSYLEAAIIRADSGISSTSQSSLIWALSNFGPNLTVFAPTDEAFQVTLTGAIAQALIAQGVPPANALALAQQLASTPDVFQNPALFSVLTAQTVRGIVVYHVLGQRAFSNNLPTTVTNFPTLLNTAIPVHPGVGLQATFGAPFVSTATIKGLANATAANILMTPFPVPEPNGTSDQNYVNGVLHKIDQVLLPQ